MDETSIVVRGLVKWFNEKRGYGFGTFTIGKRSHDFLITAKVIRLSGLKDPPRTNDSIVCEVCLVEKRWRTVKVLEILPSENSKARSTSLEIRDTSSWREARVKWFDPKRGFGFVVVQNLVKDILLHAATLYESGVEKTLTSGDIIFVRYGWTSKGPLVVSVSKERPEAGGE